MARQSSSKPHRWLSSNMMIALVSLFIASVIWMISKLDEVEVDTISIPIHVNANPENCEIVLEPKSIDVRVQYQKGFKNKVARKNIEVTLNLFNDDSICDVGDYKATPRTITLQNVTVLEASDYVRAVEIVGDGSVNVRAKKHTVLAIIEPTIQGEPAPEFRRVATIVDPPSVLLTASPAILTELEQAFEGRIVVNTEPMDITDARQDKHEFRGVILPADTKLADPDDGPFQVTVQIEELHEERDISEVRVSYTPFETGLAAHVYPSTATVTIRAPISVFEKISAADFEVKPKSYIEDTNGYKVTAAVEATFADPVPTTLREKISILKVTPPSVSVEIYSP